MANPREREKHKNDHYASTSVLPDVLPLTMAKTMCLKQNVKSGQAGSDSPLKGLSHLLQFVVLKIAETKVKFSFLVALAVFYFHIRGMKPWLGRTQNAGVNSVLFCHRLPGLTRSSKLR